MVNITNILGKYLTRYDVKSRLGSGGMATVYHAVDKNLGRDVAIKVLHEHLIHDDTFKERFEQEAKFIASFNHPNIIQIYDFNTIESEDGKIYYMVMPYLSGDTLIDVLDECRDKEATLPHDRIREIISDLAEALDYAHARGMIHRDVKPANILFDENQRAVLTDFGIARLAQTSGLTADGTIIGTPAYMSPEQATGQDTDHRSDIYSLGIILFELLTGRPPFDEDSTVSVLLNHAQTTPPPVSNFLEKMNVHLDAVLHKVLEKDPSKRYQSAVALKTALENAVNKEGDTERFQPSSMPYHPASTHKKGNSQPNTLVLDDNISSTRLNSTITRTIHTLVIKPAKQNPLGFVALAIGIIALLLIARIAQNTPLTSQEALPTDISIGVDSMAGVDSMVGDAAFFTGNFSDDDGVNIYWDTSSNNIIDRAIQGGQYRISNSQASLAITSMFDPTHFIYDDVNILMDGRILESSASESSAFGLVFRYQDAENYNVFGIDGLGRFSIWKRENGTWCELRTSCNGGLADANWQVNEAIKPIGEINTLNLNVYQNEIVGYVNGELVFMLEEDTFANGGIGIYMATTQAGLAEIAIENYNVALGMPPTADSMTSDQ